MSSDFINLRNAIHTPALPPVAVLVAQSGPVNALAQTRAALAQHPGHDIAWVGASVVLPEHWQVRLAKAAWAGPRVGAAVPLCDVDPVHALLVADSDTSAPVDVAQVDRSAYCLGDRSYYEVPRLHGMCAYLRRDALEAVLPSMEGTFPDLQSFLDVLASHMVASGWVCLLCDYVYVGFAGPQRVPSDSEPLDVRAFLAAHPLGVLRRAAGEAVAKGLAPTAAPGLDDRPVHLHVMHFWGGGVDKWVRDFARADACVNLLMASYRIGEHGGQRLVLYSDPEAKLPIRTWDIARPLPSTAASSTEYRRILEQVMREFCVDAIIVSSLIGHALDALEMACPTVVVLHDFYPVCQAINPYFGKVCTVCQRDDLRLCAQTNPLNRFFTDQTTESWDALRNRYVELLLDTRIKLVVPSASVAKTMRQISPRLQDVPMRVIGHGCDIAAGKLAYPAPGAGGLLHIVVLGRLKLHKGLELLRSAAPGLAPYARITLLGCGEAGVALAQELGWDAIERYEPGALPELLAGVAPHAGLLASIVPETFSYTLSELHALGIPPLATDMGSFQDRITEGFNGFLFNPTPAALVALVRQLHSDPARLLSVASHLAAQPAARSASDMVLDYTSLLDVPHQPLARFEVGVGQQTGLSEPYRQLDLAYTEIGTAYRALGQAYADSNSAYAELRSAYDDKGKEYANLQDEYENLRNEYSHLRVEYDSLRTEYDHQRVEYDSLRQEYDHQRVEYGSLRQEYDHLRQEYDHLRQGYDHVHGEFERVHLEYGRSREACDQLRAEIAKISSVMRAWEVSFDALDVQNRWWTMPKALRLTIDFRNKISGLAAAERGQTPKPE